MQPFLFSTRACMGNTLSRQSMTSAVTTLLSRPVRWDVSSARLSDDIKVCREHCKHGGCCVICWHLSGTKCPQLRDPVRRHIRRHRNFDRKSNQAGDLQDWHLISCPSRTKKNKRIQGFINSLASRPHRAKPSPVTCIVYLGRFLWPRNVLVDRREVQTTDN